VIINYLRGLDKSLKAQVLGDLLLKSSKDVNHNLVKVFDNN